MPGSRCSRPPSRAVRQRVAATPDALPRRLSSVCLSAATAAGPALPAAAAEVNVATTAIVEHPALDATRDGVRDELTEAGYEDGKNLRFNNESTQEILPEYRGTPRSAWRS